MGMLPENTCWKIEPFAFTAGRNRITTQWLERQGGDQRPSDFEPPSQRMLVVKLRTSIEPFRLDRIVCQLASKEFPRGK